MFLADHKGGNEVSSPVEFMELAGAVVETMVRIDVICFFDWWSMVMTVRTGY